MTKNIWVYLQNMSFLALSSYGFEAKLINESEHGKYKIIFKLQGSWKTGKHEVDFLVFLLKNRTPLLSKLNAFDKAELLYVEITLHQICEAAF